MCKTASLSIFHSLSLSLTPSLSLLLPGAHSWFLLALSDVAIQYKDLSALCPPEMHHLVSLSAVSNHSPEYLVGHGRTLQLVLSVHRFLTKIQAFHTTSCVRMANVYCRRIEIWIWKCSRNTDFNWLWDCVCFTPRMKYVIRCRQQSNPWVIRRGSGAQISKYVALH